MEVRARHTIPLYVRLIHFHHMRSQDGEAVGAIRQARLGLLYRTVLYRQYREKPDIRAYWTYRESADIISARVLGKPLKPSNAGPVSLRDRPSTLRRRF